MQFNNQFPITKSPRNHAVYQLVSDHQSFRNHAVYQPLPDHQKPQESYILSTPSRSPKAPGVMQFVNQFQLAVKNGAFEAET
jgi:hypothetical protein